MLHAPPYHRYPVCLLQPLSVLRPNLAGIIVSIDWRCLGTETQYKLLHQNAAESEQYYCYSRTHARYYV